MKEMNKIKIIGKIDLEKLKTSKARKIKERCRYCGYVKQYGFCKCNSSR